MKKPGTVNVIGEDKALDISRAIIKTHEYCLMNLDLLNDRERGYMFNEYFPAVKDYLIIEPNVLTPMEPDTPPEDLKVFTGDSVGKNYPHPANADIFTEEFRYSKNVQLLGLSLSYIPEQIKGVYIANDKAAFDNKDRYQLIQAENYIFNLSTGAIDFPEFFLQIYNKEGLKDVFESLKVKDCFSIFVEFTRVEGPVKTKYGKRYEVGTDGEN